MGTGALAVGSTRAEATGASLFGAGAHGVTSGLGNGEQATSATPASIHDALDIVPSYLASGTLEHHKTTERPRSDQSAEFSNDIVAPRAPMVRFPGSRYQSAECSGS
jgi:hypothetical protein